jgi:hypothetical protein
MKVGDLVKHHYGTMRGTGIILSVRPFDGKQARLLWNFPWRVTDVLEVETRYLEVINESR